MIKRIKNFWQSQISLRETKFLAKPDIAPRDKIQKLLGLILLPVTCYLLLFTPIFAQSPSPSPTLTPEETTSPEGKAIRDRVKELVREKIEELKKGRKAAYFGEIVSIAEGQISVSNRFGQNQILINKETKLIGANRQEISLDQLKKGFFAVAMGYFDENQLLVAKRLVVMSKPKPLVGETAFGRVADISKEENILTVKNQKKGLTYLVEVTGKTVITKKLDGNVQKITFDKIALGDRLIAVGAAENNEAKMITAKLIHVIPGKAVGQQSPTPAASPAAEATPTAKPKTTPKPTPTE